MRYSGLAVRPVEQMLAVAQQLHTASLDQYGQPLHQHHDAVLPESRAPYFEQNQTPTTAVKKTKKQKKKKTKQQEHMQTPREQSSGNLNPSSPPFTPPNLQSGPSFLNIIPPSGPNWSPGLSPLQASALEPTPPQSAKPKKAWHNNKSKHKVKKSFGTLSQMPNAQAKHNDSGAGTASEGAASEGAASASPPTI